MTDYQTIIVRERRRTVRLEVTGPREVTLHIPAHITDGEARDFISRHARWIETRLAAEARAEEKALPPYTEADIRRLADEALRVIPERCRHFAPLVGVSYGRITIRNQKSKWGSCSARGNLNFNCLLMDAPGEVLDYVVVHELCHRKEMNHSPAFWAEVARVCPDYKAHIKWLKTEGQGLMRRAHA